MAVLLTGGAGYIGGIVSKVLIENGVDIVSIDNLSKSKQPPNIDGVKFYKADIDDTIILDKILAENNINAVMHFGAFIEVGESVKEPFKYFENNFYKAMKMINHLKANGVDKVIFSSTASVYGEPKYTPIDEEHPLSPTNPYGMSKFFMERYLESIDIADNVKHVALRYFNAGGAYAGLGEEHEPETHLIPLILQVALGKREKIFINGDDYDTADGTCVRDYIHIYDIAQAHLLALKYLQSGGVSLKANLGNNKGYSINEVIDVCRSITKHSIPAEIRARREGDPSTLIASSTVAETVLGWKPKFGSLSEIISSAYHYHMSKILS